jgi:hypothetical protein
MQPHRCVAALDRSAVQEATAATRAPLGALDGIIDRGPIE